MLQIHHRLSDHAIEGALLADSLGRVDVGATAG
jgi:hypothetical protein